MDTKTHVMTVKNFDNLKKLYDSDGNPIENLQIITDKEIKKDYDEQDEETNIYNVKTIFEVNGYPNPIIIVCFCFIVVIVLQYLYIIFIKNNLSGSWYDIENQKMANINHSVWNNKILIKNNDVVYTGYVDGGAVYVQCNSELNMGVFYDNKIFWLKDNIVWTRPKYIK